MPVKVLVVDDSGFFRQRIQEILESDSRLQVVGSAANGKEAVQLAKQLQPDVITMDVEMPQMNGIEAVRLIMRDSPTSVLMLSSLTHEGAQVTLQALEAGAEDYLSKDVRAWIEKNSDLRNELVERVVALGRSKRFRRSTLLAPRPVKHGQSSRTHSFKSDHPERPVNPATRTAARRAAITEPSRPMVSRTARVSAHFPDMCRLVVIGSSTGGPAALQKVLTALPASFPYPILLVQHMPKAFTSVFAARLDQQCQIRVKEAEDGDKLQPGCALLAPGGCQMIIEQRNPDRVKVLAGDERLTYRPSVDVTYAAAAKAFGNKVLAIILTGMGADGADGARLIKQAGGKVWAQDEKSCTIYGMPQAVVKAGLADDILDLEHIGGLLKNQGKM